MLPLMVFIRKGLEKLICINKRESFIVLKIAYLVFNLSAFLAGADFLYLGFSNTHQHRFYVFPNDSLLMRTRLIH